MERLRDNDAPWGKTRTEFAQIDKRRKREREKKRRQRAAQIGRMLVAEPPPIAPDIGEVFETSSGMKAVTVRYVPSILSMGNSAVPQKIPMSLPYVAFQYGRQGE
jgi:hypothetical protein